MQICKSFLLPVLSMIFFFASCQKNQEPASLDQAFLQSFRDGKFSVLVKYLPTREFYKSLGKDIASRTDTQIDSFLSLNKQKLTESWKKMQENLINGKIDPAKISIKETVVYNPYQQSVMQAMVIVYDYNGKTWDDVTLIVKQQNNESYLLEIPNPLSAFLMTDSSMVNSSQAKVALELEKPEFQQAVQKLVNELLLYAKDNKQEDFGSNLVYNGDDKNRAWKSPVNMSDATEAKLAIEMMGNVNRAMADCSGFTFGKLQADKESEGYWIVQPLQCGKKIIRFAFLKVKDKLLLGDIDLEQMN